MALEKLIILTGTSGSGKSEAMNALEDIGFYCVDNLPVSLLTSFVAVCVETETINNAAVAADSRGAQFDTLMTELKKVRKTCGETRILFLDAANHVLEKRYKQTRRRHPLESERVTLSNAIELEREKLKELKESADFYIDTSNLSSAQLRERVTGLFVDAQDTINICVESFGFKHGIPADADLVFDVRCLPNPYWVDELRLHTGLEDNVRDYIYDSSDTRGYVLRLFDMIDYTLPLYRKEGKSQLTIAVGCTGGHHRSVAIAQHLYSHLLLNWPRVSVIHRDITK